MCLFSRRFYGAIIAFGTFLQPFLLLAMRLFWGGSLFMTGWGKLHNISSVSDFFSSLAIPFPTLNAYLVGSTEFFCGFCLMVGLASRLVSLPLIFCMGVALLTAHHEAVVNLWADPQNFISQLPFNYLLTALIVLAFGPGQLSLDYLIGRWWLKSKGSESHR
jgi:putative oxidoreductase